MDDIKYTYLYINTILFLAPTGALEEGMCDVVCCPCDYAQNDFKRVPDAF